MAGTRRVPAILYAYMIPNLPLLTSQSAFGTLCSMSALAGYLPYIQLTLSALLIFVVLMQRTGASLGGAFGADNFSSGFHTRRGFEKTLFRSTIVLGILFALSALTSLFV